jgi:ribA/ribD-fused uncharacterized protein
MNQLDNAFPDKFSSKPIPPGNSDQVISSFSGAYDFLSNFHACNIRMSGKVFYSAEQAYHYHKLARLHDRNQMLALVDPMKAKKFSRKCEIIPHWDEMRTGIMFMVLLIKFQQNGYLMDALLKTAPATLIEGNHWNDTYWGCVWKGDREGWVGENHLGRLLTIIRDDL